MALPELEGGAPPKLLARTPMVIYGTRAR